MGTLKTHFVRERLGKDIMLRHIKEVKTEVYLTERPNKEGDCGPFCVEMLFATDKSEITDDLPLVMLRQFLFKEKMEITLPINICRALIFFGYDVEYYSVINWESCTTDPKEHHDTWDPRVDWMIKKLCRQNSQGTFNLEKIQRSALWLQKVKGIIRPVFLSAWDVSELLAEGKRIIAYVGCDHFVVITGIDEEYYYFNNPVAVPRKDKMKHGEFELWWNAGSGNDGFMDAIVAQPIQSK
jgi:hypothetical protein